jgi:hypothetical protein
MAIPLRFGIPSSEHSGNRLRTIVAFIEVQSQRNGHLRLCARDHLVRNTDGLILIVAAKSG